jgi:hypothetical protein
VDEYDDDEDDEDDDDDDDEDQNDEKKGEIGKEYKVFLFNSVSNKRENHMIMQKVYILFNFSENICY